jgi:hypothetical protein
MVWRDGVGRLAPIEHQSGASKAESNDIDTTSKVVARENSQVSVHTDYLSGAEA